MKIYTGKLGKEYHIKLKKVDKDFWGWAAIMLILANDVLYTSGLGRWSNLNKVMLITGVLIFSFKSIYYTSTSWGKL